MDKHHKIFWIFILVLFITGCSAPKHYGYVIKSNNGKSSDGTALLLHAVKNFPIKISSIDGVLLNNAIKTSTNKPTYIELSSGFHSLEVSLSQGGGPCGNVMVSSEKPFKLSFYFEADKVYLLQRKSKFDAAIMCDTGKNKVLIEYYIEEIPALPYDDVRDTFEEIDLNKHNQ